MEQLSRSEKKRRARSVEKLAEELVKLSVAEIKSLPGDDYLREDIKEAKSLKAGARKRQIKYITKQLRSLDIEPFLNLLADRKGSKLKQDQLFHQLEHWRDKIITEAISASEKAATEGQSFSERWENPVFDEISANFTNLDLRTIKIAAVRYVKTRKPAFSREIFKIIKAAYEKDQFEAQK